jgi:FkbM family methyltransferase
MEIFFNANPEFTKWMVSSGALQGPFVVVDVGVLGGENPRWHFLRDHLVVHGFDAIKEVIEDLSRKNAGASNKSYHWFAIGNEDGEREFFFNPNNPTSSSLYRGSDPMLQPRAVPVRRLDTLFKEGVIPAADFIKVDVEGFERDVFFGARELLAAGVLGVESETNFSTSPIYPDTHFGLIQDVMLQHGMFVFDINFNRVPRAAYHEARKRRNLPQLPSEGTGKPATLNVLFCRDLTTERDGGLYYAKLPPRPSVDQILKAMAIYELHGLNDIAVDTAVKFSQELGQRVDVERAVDLLSRATGHVQLDDPPAAQEAVVPDASRSGVTSAESRILHLERERAALEKRIGAIQSSTSWQITAPLRSIAARLRQAMR